MIFLFFSLCVDTHKENEKEMRFALIHDVGISFFFSLFLLDGPALSVEDVFCIHRAIKKKTKRKRNRFNLDCPTAWNWIHMLCGQARSAQD